MEWQLAVYDSLDDRLVREVSLPPLELGEVRRRWNLDDEKPVPPLRVTESHRDFIEELLGSPLECERHEAAYLENFASYDGETYT